MRIHEVEWWMCKG